MTQLTTQYWHFYGMNSDPFAEEFNLHACYLSLQWKQYIEFLSDLDNYKNALVLLTGPKGVGKTTLLYQLAKSLPKSVQRETLHGEDCKNAEQLLEILQEKFNAPIENDINLNIYDKANQQLTYLQQTNKRYLLIVDDADKLSLEVQQILLHLIQQQLHAHVVLQIIFTGQNELMTTMRQIASQYKPEESKHIVNNLELDPFTYEEMDAYLQYRFEQAGLTSEQSPLTDEDLAYIFEKSDGVSGDINQLAETLLKGYFMEQHQQPDQIPKTPLLKRYLWWIGVLVVIAVLLIWVLPALQSHTDNDIKPISLPVEKTRPQQQNDVNPNPDYSQSDIKQRYQHLQDVNQNSQIENQNASQPQPVQQNNTMPQQQSITQSQVQPIKMQQSQNTIHQVATPKPAPMPVVKKAPAAAKPKLSRKSVDPHKVTSAAPAKPELTAVERELLKVNAQYYTIQLFGSYKRSDAIKFLEANRLQNEAVYFHTYFNNKNWYVVITGDYATYAQAKQAVAQLPADLRKSKPWIRSFASVHKSIRLSP